VSPLTPFSKVSFTGGASLIIIFSPTSNPFVSCFFGRPRGFLFFTFSSFCAFLLAAESSLHFAR